MVKRELYQEFLTLGVDNYSCYCFNHKNEISSMIKQDEKKWNWQRWRHRLCCLSFRDWTWTQVSHMLSPCSVTVLQSLDVRDLTGQCSLGVGACPLVSSFVITTKLHIDSSMKDSTPTRVTNWKGQQYQVLVNIQTTGTPGLLLQVKSEQSRRAVGNVWPC